MTDEVAELDLTTLLHKNGLIMRGNNYEGCTR